MAFDNSYTAVTGATYQASDYNTGTKGNFTAVWVGTTAGDLDYYTSATAKSRLAKGTALQYLRMNSGATAPEWATLSIAGALHASGIVTSQTAQATSSTTLIDITLMTTTLTLTKPCTIVAAAYGGHFMNYGLHPGIFAISIDGTVDTYGMTSHRNTEYTYPYPCVTMWRVTGVAAGSRVVKLKFMTDNAGETLTFHSGRLIALAFAET
jgi:hypothetical protein